MSRTSKDGRINRRRVIAAAAAAGAGAVAAPALAQGGKRTVMIWAHFVGANFEIFNRFLNEFNQATPDVEVKAQSFGPQEVTAKYLAAVAAGAPPDVFHAPGYVPPDMASNKVIAPLDGLVTLHPTTLKNFDPITVFNGQRFGVPVNGGLGAMCYNTELMQKSGADPSKAPATWDELIELARKMTNAQDNQWGLMLGNQAGITTAQNYYAFLLSAGGQLLAADNKATAFNSEAGLDALTFMADIVNKHRIAPRKMYSDVQAWTEWATRKVGSVLLYPVWTSGILNSKVPSMTAPPPARAKRGAHFAGNYFTLSNASRNKEAFAKFANWWAQPAISGRWAGESGAIPNSQAAIDHPEYKQFLAKNPLGQAFLDTIPFAQPFPGVVGVPGVLQIISEMVQAVVLGGEAPKDAIAKAATRADTELRRAQRT